MVKISDTCEFDFVFTVELILAVLSDGRWYSSPVIRRRLKIYKGVASGTLNRLWRQGFVIRAPNPLWNQSTRASNARFLYQATGKRWEHKQWDVIWWRGGNREKMKLCYALHHVRKSLRQLFY